MLFSGWEETLSVRAIQTPESGVRSRGWKVLCSARVALARDPGREGAQAAHLRRSLCSPRPAGGAAPPLGAPLTSAARPAPLPGRPLRPRREPGGRGPSRQPQLQPVFVASSRSPARPRLAAPGFAGGWGWGRLLPGLHAPAAARVPRRACTGPRRLQRAAARMHRPLLLRLPAPGVGGGEAGEQRWRRAAAGVGGSDAASGASAPRNSRSRWRRAEAETARGTLHRACELASCSRGGARRVLTRPWLGAARGTPGPQPRAA